MEAGSMTVTVRLDTSQFDAAIERVLERLDEVEARSRLTVSTGYTTTFGKRPGRARRTWRRLRGRST
jgi:tetrahydromethanopterin S-methyltransferase subunit G